MDLLGGKGHQGSPLDESAPPLHLMPYGEPSTCPGLGLVLAGGARGGCSVVDDMASWPHASQFCRKRGPSCITFHRTGMSDVCAHIPTFYQLSKSDGRKEISEGFDYSLTQPFKTTCILPVDSEM